MPKLELTHFRYRPREYDTDDGPWDPITGGAGALIGTLGSMMMGIADLPIETLKALRIHPDSVKSKPTAPPVTAESSSSAVLSSSSPRLLPSRTVSLPQAATSLEPESLQNKLSSSANTSQTSFIGSLSAESLNTVAESSSSVATDLTTPASSTVIPQEPSRLSVPENRSSMSQALSRSRSGSNSTSRPGSRDGSTSGSRSASLKSHLLHEYDQNKHAKLDTMLGTGKGIQRIVGAALKSPMDLSLALSRGFHNVPKLYGDDSVREVDKVTGMQSGIKTATKVRLG
jgi:hypothetical protein